MNAEAEPFCLLALLLSGSFSYVYSKSTMIANVG